MYKPPLRFVLRLRLQKGGAYLRDTTVHTNMLLIRTLCVVVLCILTLCAIFNLSIFVYINAVFHTKSCYLTDVSKAVAFYIQRIISDIYSCSNSSREVYRPYVTSQHAFVYA